MTRSKGRSKRAFSRLHAVISEEDGCFTVSVRLENHRNRSETVWGQEIARDMEMASFMLDSLAKEYSIPQKWISINIRMEKFRDGTLH